ncbi:hypothetical protein KSD_78270 [Ktedonobacter sp. SOSP1-85]|nr:hypothetical protein KSD_78270 [Ktedonobacter sp. SOSP1-85]
MDGVTDASRGGAYENHKNVPHFEAKASRHAVRFLVHGSMDPTDCVCPHWWGVMARAFDPVEYTLQQDGESYHVSYIRYAGG